jgi:hypothetical protein
MRQAAFASYRYKSKSRQKSSLRLPSRCEMSRNLPHYHIGYSLVESNTTLLTALA